VPGFELVTWYGLFAPAHTPKGVIEILSQQTALALKDPDIQRRFTEQGLETADMGPRALKQYTEQDYARWARLVKAANIHL
jgi:tripartite-type tricarboxylate transporter receptor subunit TctC